MTTTLTRSETPPQPSTGGTWIQHWDVEDPEFWQSRGKRVAGRNLGWSIFVEHVGFSVWLLWSVSAAMLNQVGFDFTSQQLFLLIAIPNLVGALLRLPYTFAVPRFGGRNWTIVSAAVLLVPTLLFSWSVQRPGTPYWVFLLIAATAGVGGGNFAASMTNINFFFPARFKGRALAVNAAGGNIGVATVQFFLPIVVGGAGAFGLVKASEAIHLERAGYLYAALAVLGVVAAVLWMNNLAVGSSSPKEQLAVIRHRHAWIVSFLYVGCFGSFIGYATAMPMLIKISFPDVNFAYYAFIGALVGSLIRPLGGWLADHRGGAVVTIWCFGGLIVGAAAITWTLSTSQPFWLFLSIFVVLFAICGVANGSVYRMIPAIWKIQAHAGTEPGTEARRTADARATIESSAVLGFAGAAGAMGGFLIPMTFGAPWVDDPVAAVKAAFIAFTLVYVVCLLVTWGVYRRPGSEFAEAHV